MAYREASPTDWIGRLKDGLDFRRRFGLEDSWPIIESMYYNVHESMSNDCANILLSQGDAMLSQVSVPNPRVSVKALNPESVEKAPLVESLSNTLLDDLNIQGEVELAVLYAYLFGTGFVKIGYDSEWGFDPSLDLGGDMKLGMTLTQLDRKGQRQIEFNSTIAPGMPWVSAVLPQDIIVPWGVRSLDRTPWIAHRIVRHIDDLRADPKYSVPRKLEPTISMRDFMSSYRSTMSLTNRGTRQHSDNSELLYVEFFEIHDRQSGKIFAVVNDCDRFIREDENALQIENRLPFASISFTPRTRALWTTPDAYYLLHAQNELADIAMQKAKQRRISTLKFLYDADSIEDKELEKVLSSDVGVAAKVNSGRDIGRAVIKLDNAPNHFLTLEEESVRANAREQIGFSRNQIGEFSGGRKTAREVATVESSSMLRMSRRGLATQRLYTDVVQITNGLVFKHWSMPRFIQVLGPEQAEQWMAMNGSALRGRYSYSVRLIDEVAEQNQKLQALQLYGSLAQDPTIDPIELRRELIREMNSPSFARVFNADVRNQVSGMQEGGRGVLPQGGQRGGSPALPMRGGGGQTGQQA